MSAMIGLVGHRGWVRFMASSCGLIRCLFLSALMHGKRSFGGVDWEMDIRTYTYYDSLLLSFYALLSMEESEMNGTIVTLLYSTSTELKCGISMLVCGGCNALTIHSFIFKLRAV
jgi:hypothetical protein